MKPLYGYVSEETCYLIEDYPYGFRLRTQMQCFLEKDPKKGFRLVTRTMNPKNGRWNAYKKSTYLRFAGCMYLDDKDHVHWSGISEYDEVEKVARFVENFPQADFSLLIPWVKGKIGYCSLMAKGKASMRMNNGVVTTDDDRQRLGEEMKVWQDLLPKLGVSNA